MKIGILTYHRSHNYGALLQAIALRNFLYNLGHEVYYIDYWPKYHINMYRIFNMDIFKTISLYSKAKYIIRFILECLLRQRRINNFQRFIDAYIVPYCLPYNEKVKYDVIIYGSDQIWRKQSGLYGKFNPVYFGINKLDTFKHVAYAASMGSVQLTEADKSFLYKALAHFSEISVREKTLRDDLLECGLKDVQIVSDPTLLLNKEQWDKLVPTKSFKSQKYILYYDLLNNSFDEKQVLRYVRFLKMRLVILRGSVNIMKNNANSIYGPEYFLSLIKNAELVFTSSYHGLLFSIIYNKPFFASFSVNETRARSILEYLGLEDRLLPPNSNIPLDSKDIDYGAINEKIKLLNQTSIDYLNQID